MRNRKAESFIRPINSRRSRLIWIGAGTLLFVSLLLLPQVSRAAEQASTDRFAYDVVVTLDATPNPVNQGDPVTISVTATGVGTSLIPGGVVEVMEGTEIVCEITLDQFGEGSCILAYYSPLVVEHVVQLKAIYPGESPFLPAVSEILNLVVKAYDVIISLDATPNPVNQGVPITISVTATGVGTSLIPTGMVEITADSELVCEVTLDTFGKGSCTINYPPAIMYPSEQIVQLQATYPGDFPFLSSISDILELVVQMPFPFETVYENDFELSAGSEWCLTDTTTAPNGENFLGQFNNTPTCLILDSLPEHNWTRISFDLYIIGTWNGNNTQYGPDEWLFSLGGETPKTFLHTTFSNWIQPGYNQAFPDTILQGDYLARTGSSDSNNLGYTYKNVGKDTTYQISYIFFHQADTVRFDFSAFGLQNIENEGWGLDNVAVMVSDTPVFQIFLPAILD
jgi:hypothetical protein